MLSESANMGREYKERQDKSRQGKEKKGKYKARQGKARQGKARRGKAGQGKKKLSRLTKRRKLSTKAYTRYVIHPHLVPLSVWVLM